MKRHLLNLLTLVSLLLFVAVAALWVRSHFGGDDIGYSRGARRYYVRTGGGEIALETLRYEVQRFPPQFRWDRDARRTGGVYMIRRDTLFKRLGFYSDAASIGTPSATVGTTHSWMVPMWLPAAAAALLPAVRLARAWRRARRSRHADRCPACGYDLRGNVSGVCPECGKPK